MKRKLLLIVLVAGLLTGCGSKIPTLSNGEDALVEFKDGTKYSANEIWEEFKETYALDIVLKKVDTKILEEKYKDKKDEIEEYVNGREALAKANFPDEDDLKEALTNAGFNTMEDYLEAVKLSYLKELAVKDYAKADVSDKEIKNYYKNEAKGDISCVHVLVKPTDTSDEGKEAAKQKAKDIISSINKEVKAGKKAKDVFESYKDNEEVTFEDLGYFNIDKMESSFEKAAYALKKGEYSKTPVQTSYGYHVILKVDEKEKDTLDNLKDDIIDKLADRKVSEDSYIETKAMVELRKNEGVKLHDSKIEDAYNKYINYLLNKKD